jgi:hypothetical protein
VTGAEAKLVSHLVARLHAEAGGCVVRLRTLETIGDCPAFLAGAEDATLRVDGRLLLPKQDVRRLLRDVPNDVKNHEDAVIWTSHDVQTNQSTVGVGMLTAVEEGQFCTDLREGAA